MKMPPMLIAVAEKPSKTTKVKVKAMDMTPETAAYKEPSPAERTVSRAHDAKVSATDSWVRGEISTAKHKQVHGRANKVIRAKGQVC